MIKKCYPFSILEVIIATSLFALLMFTTTSLFFRYHKLNIRLNDLRPKILERTLFYEKLLEMSGNITKSSIHISNNQYGECLTFEFDNGYKDNPKFSGKCLCSIFRNENKNLCFVIENEQKQSYKRQLLKNISSFTPKYNKNLLHITIEYPKSEPLQYTFFLTEKGGS